MCRRGNATAVAINRSTVHEFLTRAAASRTKPVTKRDYDYEYLRFTAESKREDKR